MARATLLSVLLGLLFIGARAQGDCTPIVDAATNAGLTTFLAALEAADLVDTVVGATGLTVFAPSNDAFDAALAAVGVSLDELVANRALLTEVLTYHVLTFPVLAANITEGGAYETLLGDDSSCGFSTIGASLAGGGVTIVGGVTNASVVTPDVETCSGIVHVIDFVLLPCPLGGEPEGVAVTTTPTSPPPAEEEEEPCVPLVQAATDAGLTTLLTAVEAAGLVDAIQAPGLTIFAPTNDAFDKAVEVLGVTIDNLVSNTELLTEILLYHVLDATVFSGDIADGAMVKTLLGNDSSCGESALKFDLSEGVKVVGRASSATVQSPDVETCTAVVHVIDFVLLPCDLSAPEPAPKPVPTPNPQPMPKMEPRTKPATECKGIVETAKDAGLTTLLTAVEAAGLVDAIQMPGLTIFAPTNDAFAEAVKALGVSIDELLNSKEVVTEVLLYHVLGTTVRAADIADGAAATTLLGNGSSCDVSDLQFFLSKGSVVVQGGETSATVVTADVETCSAVVHVIDSVLVPCPVKRMQAPSPPMPKSPPRKKKGGHHYNPIHFFYYLIFG